MNQWLEPAQKFLTGNNYAVYVAAIFILLGAAIAYWAWFRPAAVALQRSLRDLAKAIDAPNEVWSKTQDSARLAVAASPVLKAAWQETEERVVLLPHGQRTLPVMFGAPRDIWASPKILSRTLNLSLAEAVPNLLVGIGLLFTFFFLTLAITQATQALLPPSTGQSAYAPTSASSAPGVTTSALAAPDPIAATHGLLTAAGAKFLTSLAGLLASLVWTIAARRRMAALEFAADYVVDRIGIHVSFGGGEMAVFAHLQNSRDLLALGEQQAEVTKAFADDAARHAEVASAMSDKAAEQLAMTEEVLTELREQTGTFKRFETDLAVSLAGAITQAFSPQMEAMTDRLIGAIDGLSNQMGSMNQEALKKMVEDFGSMLQRATDSEMTQLRETLETLASRLNVAGLAIGSGADKAAESIDRAGAELVASTELISNNLSAGANKLEGATQGLKEAMNDLDTSITSAADLGRRGATFVREALDSADTVFSRLSSVAAELSNSSAAMERVSGQLAHAVDSVEEMTAEQRAVVNAVKEATPNALESVKRVLDLLQQTVKLTADMMGQTKESMAATSKTLGTTVSQITAGVTEYSKTVAELHRTMDSELAKAVGSLDKGVNELEGAIEELSEALDAHSSKG